MIGVLINSLCRSVLVDKRKDNNNLLLREGEKFVEIVMFFVGGWGLVMVFDL